MNIIDTLFGRKLLEPAALTPLTRGSESGDEFAVKRYEHLLRNASPETLERVHTEAFGKLSPAQRDLMFDQFVARANAEDELPGDPTPSSLAATATLVEKRQPGTIRRLFGNVGPNSIWGEQNSMFYLFVSYSIASDLSTAFFVSQIYSNDVGSSADVDTSSSGGDFFGDFGF